MFLITWSVGLGFFVQEMRARRVPNWLTIPLVLACLLEQGVTTVSHAKAENRAEIARLARGIDRRDAAFYYSARGSPCEIYRLQLDAMWGGLEAGVPTINGYSGNFPPDWTPLYYNNPRDECEELCTGTILRRWIAKGDLPAGRIGWVGGPPDWRPGTAAAPAVGD
jgi:hypothetical protein